MPPNKYLAGLISAQSEEKDKGDIHFLIPILFFFVHVFQTTLITHVLADINF